MYNIIFNLNSRLWEEWVNTLSSYAYTIIPEMIPFSFHWNVENYGNIDIVKAYIESFWITVKIVWVWEIETWTQYNDWKYKFDLWLYESMIIDRNIYDMEWNIIWQKGLQVNKWAWDINRDLTPYLW